MGLQKEILTPAVGFNGEPSFVLQDPEAPGYAESDLNKKTGDKSGKFVRGTLALGVPGNIFDATPARIMTTVLTAAAEVGTFVTGLGVIVNPREYANKGTTGNPLAPSLTLPAGSVAEICTFGHIVVSTEKIADIQSGMNCRVIVGDADNDALVVVEIDGLKDSADPDPG